jgi:hypothetical protein
MSPLASHHRESRYDSHLRSVCARARTRYRQIERRVTQVAVSRYGGAPKRAVPGEGKGTGCFIFMCEWRESGCDGYCTCWYAQRMKETVTAVLLCFTLKVYGVPRVSPGVTAPAYCRWLRRALLLPYSPETADAAACRACRDPRDRNLSPYGDCS